MSVRKKIVQVGSGIMRVKAGETSVESRIVRVRARKVSIEISAAKSHHSKLRQPD